MIASRATGLQNPAYRPALHPPFPRSNASKCKACIRLCGDQIKHHLRIALQLPDLSKKKDDPGFPGLRKSLTSLKKTVLRFLTAYADCHTVGESRILCAQVG